MRKIAVLSVATIASVGLMAGAATAETQTKKDKKDDAPAYANVTKVTVKNQKKAVIVKAKIEKSMAAKTDITATLTPTTDGRAAYVASTKLDGKKRVASLTSGGDAVECDKLKASLSAGRNGSSKFRIPQSCFGDDAGAWTVTVTSEAPSGKTKDKVKVKKVKRG